MTKPQRQSGFYWVSVFSDAYEPCRVEYENGEATEIWAIGSDVQYTPSQCVIGDPIIKPKDMK
jgi:hypothetical protein